MSLDGYVKIVVVGATGAVGREALQILKARGVPAARVVAAASERSAGTLVPYGERELKVRAVSAGVFEGADLVLFCATAAVSRQWAPVAVERGALVVDNSSAFRMSDGVPLVVPEVNGAELSDGGSQLIANPNCSTIIMLVALEPLRRAFGVERVVVSTYQAVSGAGAAAMDELREQAGAVLNGREVRPRVFIEPCAFNVFSHNSAVDLDTGLNAEERKLIDETRKIWGDESVSIVPTCVRVPVLRAHTESITVTLRETATEAQVRAALGAARGVGVIDDRARNRFPTPLKASGGDDVLVGRVRPDPCEVAEVGGGWRTWSLLVSGDQLRKGAALNAIQIAEGFTVETQRTQRGRLKQLADNGR